MRLALIGGTGDIGEGLALRFARDTDFDLVIGSRDSEKASDAVTSYQEKLDNHGFNHSILGDTNRNAAKEADIVILAVPPYYIEDTVETISDELTEETILVSPAVGMTGDEDGLHYKPPSTGSVAELVAETAPPDITVVGAGTNLSAERLANLSESFDMDTFVFGDQQSAKTKIADVFGQIDGIRPLDAGPLANAADVEALTPLLITIGKYNDEIDHAGVKIL